MELTTIDFVNKLYDNINLKEYCLVGCQHFLESNAYMIESMLKKGLDANNIHLIGKSYSYNQEIHKQLSERGMNVFEYTYNSHQSFDTQFSKQLNLFLETIEIEELSKQYEKVLVFDDGGSLIQKLNEQNGSKNIHAVEQTSSGYNFLRNQQLKFPVLNVARSKAKLEYETPYIIEDFLQKLENELEENNLQPKNALVIGNGFIGNYLSEKLNYNTTTIDIDANETLVEKLISKHDLIIGATGTTSISKDKHNLLKQGTILASISSSDREFDGVHLRKQLEKTTPHETIFANGIYLLNGGFPMNFKGNKSEVVAEHIQLTQALMLAGMYEAVQENRKGLHQLNATIQNKILRERGLLI